MVYKYKERAKEWVKANPEKVASYSRKYLLKKRFSTEMTPEKFNEMYEKQGGVCAICGSKEKGKHFSIDHNHDTGEVRGLLCNSCNMAIGHAKENTLILEKMIRYLNGWNAQD